MALTVKDIQELPSGQRMKLLAGGKGLARPVISVEIADYEFAQGLEFAPEADFDLERDMEAGSFIITSFLFAKDDPAQILPALRKMEEMGMAGLAYKQIIYRDLPEEVLEFAEKRTSLSLRLKRMYGLRTSSSISCTRCSSTIRSICQRTRSARCWKGG